MRKLFGDMMSFLVQLLYSMLFILSIEQSTLSIKLPSATDSQVSGYLNNELFLLGGHINNTNHESTNYHWKYNLGPSSDTRK